MNINDNSPAVITTTGERIPLILQSNGSSMTAPMEHDVVAVALFTTENGEVPLVIIPCAASVEHVIPSGDARAVTVRMGIEAIDGLHGDAVCALGLYLHGGDGTDRAKALKVHEDAVDALASGAVARIRERDAEIVRLNACVIEYGRLALCDVIGRVLGADVGDIAASGGDDTEALAESIACGMRERDVTIARLEAQVTRDVLTLALLRSALAAASADLAGGDARAVMVRTAIDIVLAPVPS